jgi:hypothetical protein
MDIGREEKRSAQYSQLGMWLCDIYSAGRIDRNFRTKSEILIVGSNLASLSQKEWAFADLMHGGPQIDRHDFTKV